MKLLLTLALAATTGWSQSAPVRVQMRIVGDQPGFAVTGCIWDDATPVPNWGRFLTVRVVEAGPDAPVLLGDYRIEGNALLFVPRFPLQAGLEYRVKLAEGAPGCGAEYPSETILSLPRPDSVPTTVVERVEPSARVLPENLLKFYIHFSAPMSQGRSYERIQLLDENNQPIELPFLELEPELWDYSGRRLTLLFDPGRIKRELLPNREVGSPLVTGNSYTLVVDSEWPDAEGQKLAAPFRKRFHAGPPDRSSPRPETWAIQPVEAGSRQPLEIRLDESLDGALARRQIAVYGPTGTAVTGTVELQDNERLWRLTPETPWAAGRHEILVGTTLEDLAGNSIGRPFEVDRFERVQAQLSGETVSLRFEIAPRP